MKNLQRLFAIAIFIFVNSLAGIYAQTTASATWALTADQGPVSTGTVSAAPQSLSVISVTSYTGFNGPLGVPSQRARVVSGWPQNSAYVANRYYEYAVTITSGAFNSVGVTLPMGAVSTGNLRADVFYSTDNFATSTQLNTGGYIQMPNNGYVSPAPNYIFDLPLTAGTTFSVRVFPWYTGADLSTSRYVVMQNVVINFSTGSLPLKLLSFNSSTAGNNVKLSWSTSNEDNMKAYEVEKGISINNFSSIASVAANNRSAISNYSFVDDKMNGEKSFYRLKMINKDGSFTYSQILVITGKESIHLSIYPNPFINTIVLSHPKALANAAIKIVGAGGDEIKRLMVQESATQSSFDVSELHTGSYILQYYNAGNLAGSVKFIKE